jgi:hypothetical protein
MVGANAMDPRRMLSGLADRGRDRGSRARWPSSRALSPKVHNADGRHPRRLVGCAHPATRPRLELSRELAINPERWAVPARGEHGLTSLLPDLAVWLEESVAPVALIVERGRREDRQERILDGAGATRCCTTATAPCNTTAPIHR